MSTDKNLIEDSQDYYQTPTTSTFISIFRLILIGSLLFNVSFFVCNFFEKGNFNLSTGYKKLLFLFYLCWLAASFISKKFKIDSNTTFLSGIFIITKSALYLTYCVAFVVVMLGLVKYSRLQIFSTCLMICLLESVSWSIYYKVANKKQTEYFRSGKKWSRDREKSKVFPLVIGVDILLVVVSFFVINLLKRGHLYLPPQYDMLLLLIYGLWFVCSLATKKFSIKDNKNFYFSLWQWLKAGALMLASISVIVFGFRLFFFSRFQAFGSIFLLFFLELIFLRFYFWAQNGKENNYDIESVEHVKEIFNQEKLSLNIDYKTIREKFMGPARIKLENNSLQNYPELFSFIDEEIDLNDMICMETTVENSKNLFKLNTDRIPARLFMNLHKINDVRRINQYFLQVHQMLLPGGYYIAWAHTIRTHNEWIYSKFPRHIANFIYLMDFCFKRIMPKLPWLKKIYFALSRGNGRIVSRAEVLGRLCFCGFEIVAEKDINKRFCFIARKVKTPSLDQSPTYGPFISLKRMGLNRKIIHMYKFRTMHPYSEYLQKYVYDMNGLKKGGKMNNDFRMTTWGQVMRKCWIDELPMLYNWIKGDLQLVGVRPLSPHYYNLYDDELQGLRQHVKPGLIPPFYADLPTTFEEICASEKKYIRAFLEHPVKTQCSYFWKVFFNIAFRGVRSN